MEKTIDFGHNTNGNKACFNASQKIKHYQIDPKKNKDPFKKAQVNPSISWKDTFLNGNKRVTDNSNISLKNVTNEPNEDKVNLKKNHVAKPKRKTRLQTHKQLTITLW